MTNGTWSYTWKHGRQLASMTDGSTTWNYTYDVNGLRTKRTNGTDTYNYIYTDGKLMQMTKGSDTLNFIYEVSGYPSVVKYNGTVYYYVTNLQGDVIAIVNNSGAEVVGYTYDAWGKLLTTSGTMAATLGTLNPLRYRGYVYDHETGLYYLQSRYYNPELGRFINADAYASTGQGLLGNNMFAYCGNNPVIFVDPSGEMCIADRRGIEISASGGGALELLFPLVWLYELFAGEQESVAEVKSDAIVSPQPTPQLQKDKKEVYAYQQELKQTYIYTSKNTPHVHHIVPVGNFSNRSTNTQEQILEMHRILRNADIDRFSDPNNLILISAKTHAAIHTDAYISHIHKYITQAGANKLAIYGALFCLRIEIAAMDIEAYAY